MTISIVTAALNARDNLISMHQAVNCFLSEDLDWIICDSVRSNDFAESFFCCKPYITFLKYNDLGIYDSLNYAIAHSNSDWILVLGSDDKIIYPLTSIISLLDMVHSIYSLPYTIGSSEKVYRKSPNNLFKYLLGMPLSHQSLLVKRTLLLRSPFDLNYLYASDFHWLLSQFRNGCYVTAIPYSQPLINMGSNGLSSKSSLRIFILNEFLSIMRCNGINGILLFPIYLSLLKASICQK